MPRLGCLAFFLLLTSFTVLVADEASTHKATLEAAGVKTDDASLLDFFHKRTLTEADRTRLADLIQQLGSANYGDRVRATDQLIASGRKAVAFLQPAVADPDPEIARRARRCLKVIGTHPDTDLVLSAARLLAGRKLENALPTLLAFLPFLEEAAVEEELFRAAQALCLTNNKPHPALLAAIQSKAPRQRAAAAWILGRSATEEDRERIAPLLRDEDAGVRYRAAESLLLNRDRRALPVLIGLLEKSPIEFASQAEALLLTTAGDRSPEVSLGLEPEQRRSCHDAWQGWWREYGVKLDLARLDSEKSLIGLRLVAANSGYGGGGAIWEYGGDRKIRWQLRQVGGPFDVQVLPGGRVLLAEYNDRRVTERDRNGKVLWEYRPPNAPLEVQRLLGGNLLIATNYEILEVTRDQRIVFNYRDTTGNIFSAQRLSSGNILFGLYSGSIVEIDRSGKEVHRFAIERPRGLANIVVLPGGRYLLPCAGSNRVVEMDRNGKVVREIEIPGPTCVALLPNGNLVVGSHIQSNVREVDRKGKVLWEQKAEGQVFRVRVR